MWDGEKVLLGDRRKDTPTADFGHNQTLSETVSFCIKLDHNVLAACTAWASDGHCDGCVWEMQAAVLTWRLQSCILVFQMLEGHLEERAKGNICSR